MISRRGATGLLLVVGALSMSGCDLLLDPNTASNTIAPRIDRSFPEDGVLEIVSGSLLFSAEGEDDDSLDLSWTWQLDGDVQAAGTSADGSFDTGWELQHDPTRSGETVDVRFEVSDGSLSAELIWTVDVR